MFNPLRGCRNGVLVIPQFRKLHPRLLATPIFNSHSSLSDLEAMLLYLEFVSLITHFKID